jgi:hypothetical protein
MSTVQTATLRTPSLAPVRDSFPLQKAVSLLLNQQTEEGYWWYTLEANETIGAGFIQLMHFIGAVDPDIQEGLSAGYCPNKSPTGPGPSSTAVPATSRRPSNAISP